MPKAVTAPIAAEVRQDTESEAALIHAAKQAVSSCNWKVGECAAKWTQAYSKGRTDADFGAAVGISGDHTNQCRRVWERWGEISDTYRNLSWSHFYAALTWEGAEAYLEWASANYASVAELKAYRTAKTAQEFLPADGERGGDPFQSDDDPFGEGEGAGTEAGGEGTDSDGEDEQDAEGTETEEEQPNRPPRNGREASEADPKEVFLTTKAKAVKTLEAGMRAVDDLNRLRRLPQHDKLIKGLEKMLQTVKSVD